MDFAHARIQEVILGPRRELTLMVRRLVWESNVGHHSPLVTVRFGGIFNFEEVKAFFAVPHHERSELGQLLYDTQQPSKAGHLYLVLEYERVDARIVIECSTVSVQQIEVLTTE